MSDQHVTIACSTSCCDTYFNKISANHKSTDLTLQILNLASFLQLHQNLYLSTSLQPIIIFNLEDPPNSLNLLHFYKIIIVILLRIQFKLLIKLMHPLLFHVSIYYTLSSLAIIFVLLLPNIFSIFHLFLNLIHMKRPLVMQTGAMLFNMNWLH